MSEPYNNREGWRTFRLDMSPQCAEILQTFADRKDITVEELFRRAVSQMIAMDTIEQEGMETFVTLPWQKETPSLDINPSVN